MIKKGLVALFTAFLISGCSSVPITGRQQLLLVSDSEVLSSSLTQYDSYIKSSKKSTSVSQTNKVKRVGKRIAEATERYLRENNLSREIANFKWEFNLIQDSQINAFCMPGGKIVVYEGLMKIAQTDDELAVVLGHEVAHAVAKHSNERMSQQLAAEYGAKILSASLSDKSQTIQDMATSVYGLGAQYGLMLPFSRKHESEADYMGLVFMTMAGYTPDVAINFWKKMSAGSQGHIPEMMSTHPSDATRINAIYKALPEIKRKYQK